jgi:hypothetical protein
MSREEKRDLESLDSLHAALHAERECCSALAEILRAERAAAAGHDLEGLIAALRERGQVQARWQGVARRRDQLLGGETQLAERAAGDRALSTLRAELAGEAARVRREQAVNEAVLRRSLDAVTELLGAIRRRLPSARYDGGAAITASAPAPSSAGWRA